MFFTLFLILFFLVVYFIERARSLRHKALNKQFKCARCTQPLDIKSGYTHSMSFVYLWEQLRVCSKCSRIIFLRNTIFLILFLVLIILLR